MLWAALKPAPLVQPATRDSTHESPLLRFLRDGAPVPAPVGPAAAGFHALQVHAGRCARDDFVMNAFPADSEFAYWWSPSPDVMRSWHGQRTRGRFSDPHTQQFKVVVDEEGAAGRVVAFAKWDTPRRLRGLRPGFVVYDEKGAAVEVAPRGAEDEQEKKAQRLSAPMGANEELYEDFFDGLERMGRKWDVDEKLVLSIICTDPAYHGRGIAAALIRSVLAVADAEGVPAYLEALPLAVPLYRRLGFVAVDTLEYDLTRAGRQGKAVLTIMVREPAATGV
ncbi:hypothetical protein AAE478_002286 [Parahypoxylon ruwenzoriense]